MKLYGMLPAFNQSLEAGMMDKSTADELLGHTLMPNGMTGITGDWKG